MILLSVYVFKGNLALAWNIEVMYDTLLLQHQYQSLSFSFVCFIIFLAKAFLDFELLVLCLVVVHRGISPYWPRGCTLTHWGKVTWTFQHCAQTLMALKTYLFFFILHIFSSAGLHALVRSVSALRTNSFSTYAHRAIVIAVEASLISSPQMTLVRLSAVGTRRGTEREISVCARSNESFFREHPLQCWFVLCEHLDMN